MLESFVKSCLIVCYIFQRDIIHENAYGYDSAEQRVLLIYEVSAAWSRCYYDKN